MTLSQGRYGNVLGMRLPANEGLGAKFSSGLKKLDTDGVFLTVLSTKVYGVRVTVLIKQVETTPFVHYLACFSDADPRCARCKGNRPSVGTGAGKTSFPACCVYSVLLRDVRCVSFSA